MDALSSCYFCGRALEEPLSEYDVVPDELNPDPDLQQSVVLCRGCRRKLDTVLQPVVEAAVEDELGEVAESSPTSDDGSVADATAAAETEGESGGRDEPGDDAGPEPPELDDVPRLDSVGTSGGDDPLLPAGRSTPGEDALAPESGTPADDTGNETRQEDDAENEAPADVASRVGSETAHDERESHETSREPKPDGETVSEGSTTDDEETNAETDSTGDERTLVDDETHSISALEYNKVMRLVQNREFPVDRREIESVAANAYGLSHEDCERIIDAAIERGLLAQDGKHLVTPDE